MGFSSQPILWRINFCLVCVCVCVLLMCVWYKIRYIYIQTEYWYISNIDTLHLNTDLQCCLCVFLCVVHLIFYAKLQHIYTEVGWCLMSGPFLLPPPLSFPATEARRRSSSWSTRRFNLWWFPSRRHDHSSPNSWFIRDNPIKKIGLGSPHLWKSPSVAFGPGNCSCRMSTASRHV